MTLLHAPYAWFALLALVSFGPIVLPFLWVSKHWRTDAQNVAERPVEEGAQLWREQRAELDLQLANGLIDGSEHAAALAALTQAAKSDLHADALPSAVAPSAVGRRASPAPARRPWLAAWLLVLGLALVLPVYDLVGTPDAATRLLAAQTPTPAQVRPSDPQVVAMVQSLAKKLADRPDDLKGWRLLGRSYMVIGDYANAVRAYQHASTLDGQDAQLFADLADASAMQAGGRLAGLPSEMIAKALALDGANPKALELAGTAALQRGDASGARTYWTRLKSVLPPDSEDIAQIDAALLQVDAVAARVRAGAGPVVPAAAPQAGPAQAESEANTATIAGMVDIAPALATQVSLADVVYLSARDAHATGPASRIPLAVMRLDARRLPAPFTLSDAMAMDPAHKLSASHEVLIEAHIAKHGTPITTAGDLASPAVTAVLGASGVKLVIDHVVP